MRARTPLLLLSAALLLLLARPALGQGEGELVVVATDAALSVAVVEEAQAATERAALTIGGADVFATAAAVAETHDPGVDVAFLATADTFADALAAGPLAAREGGPILLTEAAGLPTVTADALARLAPAELVVLGGTAAITDDVVAAAQAAAGAPATRLAGANRWATAVAVSARANPDGAAVVHVATGEDFADALTGGVAAAVADGPLLLVRQGDLPAETVPELERLAPEEIVVLGGTAAVSAEVEAALAAHAPTRRLAGETRFETAVAIAEDAFPDGAPRLYLTSGQTFHDALVTTPLAGALPPPASTVPAGESTDPAGDTSTVRQVDGGTHGPILLAAVDVLPDSTGQALGAIGTGDPAAEPTATATPTATPTTAPVASTIAQADAFDAVGNTPLAVGQAPPVAGRATVEQAGSLLDNDRNATTVTSADGASEEGGTVDVAADGTFTYTPPVGFTGTDRFSYAITGPHGGDSATVTITVADLPVYVDGAVAGPGDGTALDPFPTLADAEAASVVGTPILVHDGADVPDGIALQADQRLLGGTAEWVVGTTTVRTAGAGARPGAGATISLADGVLVEEVDVDAADVGIDGGALAGGMATVRGAEVTGPRGLLLAGTAGQVTISDAAFTGDQQAVHVDGGSVDLTLQQVTIDLTADLDGDDPEVVVVEGSHTGTVTIDATSSIAAVDRGLVVFGDVDGTYDIAAPVDLAGPDTGLLVASGGADVDLADLTIADAEDWAVRVVGTSGPVTLDTVDVHDLPAGSNAFLLDDSALVEVLGGTIDTVSEDAFNTDDTSVRIAGVTISNLTDAAGGDFDFAGAGDHLLDIDDLTVTGTGNAQEGVIVSNVGTGTLDVDVADSALTGDDTGLLVQAINGEVTATITGSTLASVGTDPGLSAPQGIHLYAEDGTLTATVDTVTATSADDIGFLAGADTHPADLILALDGPLTATGANEAPAVDLFLATVTALDTITVPGVAAPTAADGAGVSLVDVVFDADPTTGGAQEVQGTITVGDDTGNRTRAPGLDIAPEVGSDLLLTDLAVHTVADGSPTAPAALYTEGLPNTAITLDGAVLDAVGGPALQAQSGVMTGMITRLSSSGAAIGGVLIGSLNTFPDGMDIVEVDIDDAGGFGMVLNGVDDLHVQGGTIDGGSTVGGIVGYAWGDLRISDVVFGATSSLTGPLVDLTAADTTTLLLEGLTCTAAACGLDDGILLDVDGVGSSLTATLQGNDIRPTGQALRTEEHGGAGALRLDLSGNTWGSDGASWTGEVTGGAAGSTVVTGWTGEVVIAGGTNLGWRFDTVTFDDGSGGPVVNAGSAYGQDDTDDLQPDGISLVDIGGALTLDATTSIFTDGPSCVARAGGAGVLVDNAACDED